MPLDLKLNSQDLNLGQWRLLQSRSPVVLMSGGFGSGKTLGLGLKHIQLKNANPGVPGLLVAPTWRTLWSVTLRRLMNFLAMTLPRDKLPKVKDRQGECYLDWGDGVPVFLRSANNPDSMDGLDVGWALGDELRYWPSASYEVLLGRVRVPCALPQSCFASTPAMNFMAEEFDRGKADRELIIAPTRENARNLSPGFIRNLRQSYSPRLQRAVIDGEFTILEGAVYEAFDSHPQKSPWFVDYNPYTAENRANKTYLAADPGFQRSAWIWLHELTPTKWIAFHQMMPVNMSDNDCVREINAFNKKTGISLDEIWIDPAADNTQSAYNLDTLAMVKGIRARTKTPVRYITGRFREISYGVDKLRTILGDPYSKYHPLRLGFSRQLVYNEQGKVRGIVKDLASLHYPEIKDGRPLIDKPVKDGVTDHSTDALRYWAVGMWLRSPLRKLDHSLTTEKGGYKIAA